MAAGTASFYLQKGDVSAESWGVIGAMTDAHNEEEKQIVVSDATQQLAATEGEVPTVQPEVAAEPTPSEEASVAGAQQDYEESCIKLEPGQIIKGRVVLVGDDEVMVNVGYKSEGRIPLHEMGLRGGQKPSEVVQIDDEIDVYVLKVEDAEGNVLLSRKRAESRVIWEKLDKMFQDGAIIEAKVTERVKGGLLVDVGVRGFVPASQVARTYVENLEKFVGETLRFKIMEIDKQKNNVVLSHKSVLEAEYAAAKEEVFAGLKEGAVLEGVVQRITDFGAFIDIGSGVEGLLHVSEMAWSRVKHPSDVVKEGERIKVMVLNLDKEHERISLSLKETLPDPWETAHDRYVVGEVVEGDVTRVVDFGAFIKLEDGIEGLVHISQMADHHVTNAAEVATPGQKVKVKIVSLDERARRIGLSMREALPKPPKQPKEPKEKVVESTGYSDPTDGAPKLGDVYKDLSALLEQKKRDEAEDKG